VMAKPGPAAKPFEQKILEGNRGRRALNLGEVFRPEVGMPSVPKDMSPGARKVFKRLGTELLRYNLMSVVYSDIFEDLCETVALVKELRHSLRSRANLLLAEKKDPASAYMVNTPNGMPVQHPQYQILKAERQMMYSLLAKFGLSPAEQASVTTAIKAQMPLFDSDKDGSNVVPFSQPDKKPTSFAEF
jgi:P27 family predicted phage terminase small subunit